MTDDANYELLAVSLALGVHYDHSRGDRLTQIFVEGRASEYRQLAQILSSPAQPKGVVLRLLQVEGLSSPSDGDYTNIGILWGGDAIRVLHFNDTLLITGGEESLDVLAANIRFFADQIDQPHAKGTHLHIEYWDGIGYLEPGTPSIILEELKDE